MVERLIEEERHAERGASDGEVGIAVERLLEALDAVGAEAQQGADSAIAGVDGRTRGGGHRQPEASENGMALILAVLPKHGHLILSRVRRGTARWAFRLERRSAGATQSRGRLERNRQAPSD